MSLAHVVPVWLISGELQLELLLSSGVADALLALAPLRSTAASEGVTFSRTSIAKLDSFIVAHASNTIFANGLGNGVSTSRTNFRMDAASEE